MPSTRSSSEIQLRASASLNVGFEATSAATSGRLDVRGKIGAAPTTRGGHCSKRREAGRARDATSQSPEADPPDVRPDPGTALYRGLSP